MTTESETTLPALNDVFTPTRPIDLPEFLAGRQDLMYRVSDAVDTEGLHVLLFGERGTGKTSIARVLGHVLQNPDEKGRRAILISCDSIDDFKSIWRKVSQEVLISERQLGFGHASTAAIIGSADIGDAITDPNSARLFIRSLPNETVIIMDEFDRVPLDGNGRQLMADTIKHFADTNVPATIVLVGVAESIGELFGEHQSILRNLAQVPVEPMDFDELAQIISSGFGRVGFDFDSGLDQKIARLSQGYPHYTHLLGLWAGRQAQEAGQSRVTAAHLEAAIPLALENATGGVQQQYENAIASPQTKHLYREVLLACAMAEKDSVGRFSAVDVREPLRQITGQDYNTGAYQAHLAKFTEDVRGPVLRRTGERKHYRWRFVSPHLIPYIRLQGVRDGMIAAD